MKVLRNASLYLLFDIINKAIPFFLLPIITIYLSLETYGSLSIFTVFVAFLTPMIQLALHTNISRSYYSLDKQGLGKLIFNLEVIGIVVTIISIIIGWFFQHQLEAYFSIPSFFYWLLPLSIFLSTQTGYLSMIQMYGENVYGYGFLRILTTVINVSITLILLISFKMDWIGRVYGILGSMIIVGTGSMIFMTLRGYFYMKIDWQLIKSCLAISVPLVPHSLSAVAITFSDRLFIEELIGKEAVGLYSVGYSLGMIMSFLILALKNAIFPWIYKRLQTASPENILQRQLKLVRFTYLYVVALVIFALGITVGCHIIIYFGFLPEKFAASKDYIFWVSMAYAFQGIMFIIMPYMAHVGKTTYYFPLSVFAAVINLIGNYYFILAYGAIGAAYSTLLSYFVWLIATWIYAHWVYPMPWFSSKAFIFNYKSIKSLFEED